MLDVTLSAQLSQHLTNLKHPIELIASLDDSKKSGDLAELLREVAELSDLITVRTNGDDARRPSFSIERTGTDVTVGFAGIPLGHEFTSLVLALLHVGGHPPRLSDETIRQIRDLEGTYRFETFMSLSCQNCPDVVQALNVMSVINPNIHHVAIDGALFQDEVDERKVMAVPTVFRDGELFGQGRTTVEEILTKLDTGVAARDAAAIDSKDPFEVLVIGGGPAGAAASIYAVRKGFTTGIVAERFGGQVLDTMSIENFISVPYTEGPKLANALEEHVREYDVDIMNLQLATALTPATEEGGLIGVELASGASVHARSVVLSTGARWRHMDVPGEIEYLNKGVAFCPHCDGPLFKGKRIAVIGGGNSGVEAAIDLAGIVAHVTVIEFDTELRADDVLQRKLRSMGNVDIILNALTTEVLGDGEQVTGLVYQNRSDNTAHTVELAGIFVQIGLLPNTEWLRGTLDLSDRGEIIIDARGATSLPGVFAAGDCTTVPYKQIVIAMGAGAIAGLSAFDHLIRTSAPSEVTEATATDLAEAELADSIA